LAHSYNVATARLGLALGLDAVIDTLRRLGIEQQLNPYPSLVLGAVELSPLEVTRMYQTFASGGFRMPLRAISAVLAVDRTPLQRYPLSVQSVIDPAANLLISNAMQYAVREGTGVAIFQTFPQEHFVAGKTGTTDDLRDSWFAGFTDERLGVVWIGRDDNQSTGLTGSSGALLVWRDLFSQFTQAGWTQPAPEGIEYHWIDPVSGLLADAGCADAVQLPFISSSAPLGTAPCKGDESPRPGTFDWFKRLLE
jgi:penicillin-binding protein 1B